MFLSEGSIGKELPETAMRKYGNCMADHTFIEVPNCGKPWQVELRTSAQLGLLRV
ncbi:hypothetical protein RchiOBHm_Chr2g0171901 [Rosa chinensis]|uniref:Uncharacterized protein n=1 Tax=Rosa chinensis TaxID=74649 RepID=A0A2P6S5F5_ROSCH|nr:hypothetical protein RchiOBHm_Chr2g0171901 [Rosa chinensis]